MRLIRYYAGMADKIEGKTYSQFPDRIAYGFPEPYGVVGAITPFNANAVMVALKAAPAMVAGNCMVLKAPETAPLLVFTLIELALEAGIPPGVLNVITGRGHVVGPMLMENSTIGLLSFTGSVEAGRAVVRQSATHLMPLVLELGGKSPVIMLEDANLDFAVPSAVHSNFVKSGQSCVAGSRILVHSSIYDEVCARVAEFASGIRVGLPTDERSQMSTLVSKRQREHVDALVSAAVDAGATRLSGGAPATWEPLEDGAFYQPTVLADVEDDNPAALREAFGPMASLLKFDTVDEALARANASEFGLSSQVWGNDARGDPAPHPEPGSRGRLGQHLPGRAPDPAAGRHEDTAVTGSSTASKPSWSTRDPSPSCGISQPNVRCPTRLRGERKVPSLIRESSRSEPVRGRPVLFGLVEIDRSSRPQTRLVAGSVPTWRSRRYAESSR